MPHRLSSNAYLSPIHTCTYAFRLWTEYFTALAIWIRIVFTVPTAGLSRLANHLRGHRKSNKLRTRNGREPYVVIGDGDLHGGGDLSHDSDSLDELLVRAPRHSYRWTAGGLPAPCEPDLLFGNH